MRLGIALLVLAGCGRPAPAVVVPPVPALCALDLSGWSHDRDGPFVSATTATRALRPAVLALQARVCACATTMILPRSVRFRMLADPGHGRTEVKPQDDAAPCLRSFVVTYPAFDFTGDNLACTPTCHAPQAVFATSLEVPLD